MYAPCVALAVVVAAVMLRRKGEVVDAQVRMLIKSSDLSLASIAIGLGVS